MLRSNSLLVRTAINNATKRAFRSSSHNRAAASSALLSSSLTQRRRTPLPLPLNIKHQVITPNATAIRALSSGAGPQGQAWVDPSAVPKGENLKKYSRNLTKEAMDGKLDPVCMCVCQVSVCMCEWVLCPLVLFSLLASQW